MRQYTLLYRFYDILSHNRQSFQGYGLTSILPESDRLYNEKGAVACATAPFKWLADGFKVKDLLCKLQTLYYKL